MVILILIDVQYSHKAVFSFEKGLIGQNHSSSGYHHPVKKFAQANFPAPPLTPYCYLENHVVINILQRNCLFLPKYA